MPVGHRLGGVLLQRTRTGKLQTIGEEDPREDANIPRETCARENETSEKDKESQAKNANNSNKTSNGNKHDNCKKQMKKPRPTPILVFGIFSPARS